MVDKLILERAKYWKLNKEARKQCDRLFPEPGQYSTCVLAQGQLHNELFKNAGIYSPEGLMDKPKYDKVPIDNKSVKEAVKEAFDYCDRVYPAPVSSERRLSVDKLNSDSCQEGAFILADKLQEQIIKKML